MTARNLDHQTEQLVNAMEILDRAYPHLPEPPKEEYNQLRIKYELE